MGALDSLFSSIGTAIGKAAPKLADLGVAYVGSLINKKGGGVSGAPVYLPAGLGYDMEGVYGGGGVATPAGFISEATDLINRLTQGGAFGPLLPALPGSQTIHPVPVAGASSMTSPFTNAGTPKLFVTSSPRTGGAIWFRPAGRPILFSGDLQTCKRVRKIAGRVRRRVGGR